jgi:hypothetical protein
VIRKGILELANIFQKISIPLYSCSRKTGKLQLIYEFRPLYLSLDCIGPFQDKPYEVDFTDKKNRPCNLFLLTSKNGLGKTIILETMSCLVGLLEQAVP